jgi:hypothetical protein
MSKNTLRRAFDVEVKIIDKDAGLVDYVASNETLDCYNEVVSARGWRFTRFQKNAPFVNSHNYSSIDNQLGKVVSATLQGRDLVERVQWAKDIPENTLAQLGWKMTIGGFLKAVSVGFIPVRYVRNGADGWTQALTELGIKPEDGAAIRYIYLEHEQIELSACIIGANPDALAKSYSAGCVKDADLASVGFTDDDMSFLTIAGKALDKPDLDELTRSLIAREMGRITGRNHSQGNPTHHTSNSAGKPGGAEIAERQAAERKAFLGDLQKALSL